MVNQQFCEAKCQELSIRFLSVLINTMLLKTFSVFQAFRGAKF